MFISFFLCMLSLPLPASRSCRREKKLCRSIILKSAEGEGTLLDKMPVAQQNQLRAKRAGLMILQMGGQRLKSVRSR